MRRAFLSSLALAGLVLSGRAQAAGAAEQKDAKDLARAIDLPNMVVPIDAGGQLINYVFMTVRINVGAGVDIWKLRDRVHFLRHEIIKAFHAETMASGNKYAPLDQAKALAAVKTAIKVSYGEVAISSVELLEPTAMEMP